MQSLVFEDKNLFVFATLAVIISDAAPSSAATGVTAHAVRTNKNFTIHVVVRSDDAAQSSAER
jgi:hypothetical protein